MRTTSLLFAGLVATMLGCSAGAEAPPPLSVWELAPPPPPAESQVALRPRKTIVLGSGDSPTYDPMSSDLVRPQGNGGTTIVLEQHQTVNNYVGGYGYGYGPSYYSPSPTGFGRGTEIPISSRPSNSQLAPGGNWPAPAQYGPRMLGDRSR